MLLEKEILEVLLVLELLLGYFGISGGEWYFLICFVYLEIYFVELEVFEVDFGINE